MYKSDNSCKSVCIYSMYAEHRFLVVGSSLYCDPSQGEENKWLQPL